MSANANIQYGTSEHNRLLQMLLSRYNLAMQTVGNNIRRWTESERLFKAYLPRNTDEQLRRAERYATGKQYPFIVEVPYTYAVVMAAHTYWSTVFLSRSPIFQFMARHGDVHPDAPLALETLIDYQLSRSNSIPCLYYWLLDAPKYGYGVIGVYWDTKYKQTVKIRRLEGILAKIFGSSEYREIVETLDYEGNTLFNVRPHDFIYDTRLPLWRFQDGEFCGRIVMTTISDIATRVSDGTYMNVDIVAKKASKRRATLQDLATSTSDRYSSGVPGEDIPEQQSNMANIDEADPGSVELIELYVKVIPALWGLGDSEKVEIWRFTVANRSVIIEARPFDSISARFPYFVLPYELDAYAASPRSMIESVRDLNYILSWLFNSHIQNVRRAINNQFIVDPSRINLRDFEHGGEGLLVRVKPTAYGQDVRGAFQQIPVADVTQTHIRDARVVEELIHRVTGVNDAIMGMLDPGGRKTATEVRTAVNFGINRLRTLSEFFSAVGFTPLARTLVINTQQYMRETRQYRTRAGKIIEISPEFILGEFDFVPVDGTIPVDRYAQANLWLQIFQQLAQIPNAVQQYDLLGIVNHVAQLMGVKSLDHFRIKVSPDEEVMNAAEAGQLVGLDQLELGQAGSDTTGLEPTSPEQGMGNLESRIG